MAGASSGWFKSSTGVKRKVFISTATMRAWFPGESLPFIRETLRDEDDRGWLVDQLAQASAQPAGQAKTKITQSVSRIPQRSQADIALRTQETMDEIRSTVSGYNARDTRTPEQIATLAVDTLKRAVENASVAMRVTPSILEKVLSSSFKNQHATGTSGENFDPEGRADWESEAFGMPMDGPPESFPVYGYMMPPGLTRDIDYTASYGSVRVVFKDAIKDRTTITAGDSLGAPYMPTPLNAIGLTSINGRAVDMANLAGKTPVEIASGVTYIEAQIHGSLTASDIASVQFTKAIPPSKAMQKTLASLGISWSFIA